MDKLFDQLGIWFCVLVLVLVGTFIGVFFELSLITSISFLSNIATVLGFLLALKAYRHWVRQETVSLQKQALREILIEIVELEDQVHNLFSSAVLEEAGINLIIFPNDKAAYIHLEEILQCKSRLRVLMRKYYLLELQPSKVMVNRSKWSLVRFNFDGDLFSDLKDLLNKLNYLNILLSDNHTLHFCEGKLKSSKPIEQRFYNDHSSHFYNQKHFNGISCEFQRHITKVLQQLHREIS
ncbi:hypothetical protein AB6E22_21875 [Vibrio cyclitrophicus]|uniref:hypothetical protein n=1 Tax=Vibrio cyclitrophicus TaxID=47951 RepID=UPI000C81C38B|nr:hypothetical protein [Vibrio cyclitrophicus]PMK77617.1 hypothetical protein BCT91_08460 [Vibrio cyclitrophicus]